MSKFLEEAVTMKDFEHQNVLTLLGVAVRNDKPLIIMPFMAKGDLRSFVLAEVNVSIKFC